MGRQNIFTTLSVASVIPASMRQELMEFLITHRQHLLPPIKANDVFKSRFSGRSMISEIYQRLLATSRDQNYALIRLPSKSTALHEVVDMTFVPFDLLQLKEANTVPSKSLAMIPELNDKLVINVTDITKANGELSDITQFQCRVVRDFLSRSYYTSSGNVWISPTLVRYVAKVYSMTIGGQIARLFNLSPLMTSFVQTLFCLFFVGKMTSTDLAPAFVKAHAKHLGLFDSQDLLQIFAFTEDTLHKQAPESLEDVFAVIDAYGHSQIHSEKGSRLNRSVLNAKFSSLHTEGRVSTIALEYPPYFLFLILLVFSNHRMGLTFSMKNNPQLLNEGKDVLEQALRSMNFTSI